MTKIESTTTATATAQDDLLLTLHEGVTPSTLSCWPGRPQRILVAGEDVVSLAAVVDAVSAPQREVHSTACSELALELALQLHFDLVVLHLDRPGAGGIEVGHCIRTCHELQQPTIVVISRPLDEDTWTQARSCGADLVLAEPGSIVDTTTALRPVLQ